MRIWTGSGRWRISSATFSEWTISPRKAAGAPPPASFRQHSTSHRQKHGSGEGLDSGKNRGIWMLTCQNITGKRNSYRLSQPIVSSASQHSEWCLGLVWHFPKVPDSFWAPCVACLLPNFSRVLWRGLT